MYVLYKLLYLTPDLVLQDLLPAPVLQDLLPAQCQHIYEYVYIYIYIYIYISIPVYIYKLFWSTRASSPSPGFPWNYLKLAQEKT